MSREELEGSALGESGTELGSYGYMSSGNGDVRIEIYPLGD